MAIFLTFMTTVAPLSLVILLAISSPLVTVYAESSSGTSVLSVENTLAAGGKPSVFDDIIAFVTDEGWVGQDLDGDGHTLSGVLQYYDISAKLTVNTMVRVRPGLQLLQIHDEFIAFDAVPHDIGLYNITSRSLVSTGVVGGNPTIYEDIVAFDTKEALVDADLNGDGDLHDTVIRYYDLKREEIFNTGAEGEFPSLYGNIIAFRTFEYQAGEDWNNDGSLVDPFVRYYNISSRSLFIVAEGSQPKVYGNLIAYGGFSGLSFYDLVDGSRENTGIVIGDIAFYEGAVAFSDFRDDRYWIALYDIASGFLLRTSIFGLGVGMHEDVVAFANPEDLAGIDFNKDGDRNDSVIRFFEIDSLAELSGRRLWTERKHFLLSRDEDGLLTIYALVSSGSPLSIQMNISFNVFAESGYLVWSAEAGGLTSPGVSRTFFATSWKPPEIDARYLLSASCSYRGATVSIWRSCLTADFWFMVSI